MALAPPQASLNPTAVWAGVQNVLNGLMVTGKRFGRQSSIFLQENIPSHKGSEWAQTNPGTETRLKHLSQTSHPVLCALQEQGIRDCNSQVQSQPRTPPTLPHSYASNVEEDKGTQPCCRALESFGSEM